MSGSTGRRARCGCSSDHSVGRGRGPARRSAARRWQLGPPLRAGLPVPGGCRAVRRRRRGRRPGGPGGRPGAAPGLRERRPARGPVQRRRRGLRRRQLRRRPLHGPRRVRSGRRRRRRPARARLRSTRPRPGPTGRSSGSDGRGWPWWSRSSSPAEVAGVLFTRNPVTGAAERVIEASWGLGEAVVAGSWSRTATGSTPAAGCWNGRSGEKDVALRRRPGGGTREVAGRRRRTCTRPAWTTRSSPRCTRLAAACDARLRLPRARHRVRVPRPAQCSCCSGGRSPVGERAGRDAGLGAAPARLRLADAAELDDDRGRAARASPASSATRRAP